jgi:hypothetical protein
MRAEHIDAAADVSVAPMAGLHRRTLAARLVGA